MTAIATLPTHRHYIRWFEELSLDDVLPVALAEWALKDQPGWTRDRILAAMNGSQPRRVNLTRPIQVILFYITAVVMPEDGTIRFAEDIYGPDTKVDRALTLRHSAR